MIDPSIIVEKAVTDSSVISAVRNGHLDELKELIKKGGNIHARDRGGDTALNEASRLGHDKIARWLIDNGADVNAKNGDGRTALMWAASNPPSKNIMIMLINSGADPDLKNKKGQTALDYAHNSVKHILQLPSEEWVKVDKDVVSHIETYPRIERKLTSIFNFKTRERLIISENIRTNAESITPPASFDDLPELTLREAISQSRQLGMEVDENSALRGIARLDKAKYPPVLNKPIG